jgi:hypothetical protein
MKIFYAAVEELTALDQRLLAAVREDIPDIIAERYSDIREDVNGTFIQVADQHLHILTGTERDRIIDMPETAITEN